MMVSLDMERYIRAMDIHAAPFGIDPDRFVIVPDGPGLGVEFDLEAARRKFPFE